MNACVYATHWRANLALVTEVVPQNLLATFEHRCKGDLVDLFYVHFQKPSDKIPNCNFFLKKPRINLDT